MKDWSVVVHYMFCQCKSKSCTGCNHNPVFADFASVAVGGTAAQALPVLQAVFASFQDERKTFAEAASATYSKAKCSAGKEELGEQDVAKQKIEVDTELGEPVLGSQWISLKSHEDALDEKTSLGKKARAKLLEFLDEALSKTKMRDVKGKAEMGTIRCKDSKWGLITKCGKSLNKMNCCE